MATPKKSKAKAKGTAGPRCTKAQMLLRVEFALQLMGENKNSHEIQAIMAEKYKITEVTAETYCRDANKRLEEQLNNSTDELRYQFIASLRSDLEYAKERATIMEGNVKWFREYQAVKDKLILLQGIRAPEAEAGKEATIVIKYGKAEDAS